MHRHYDRLGEDEEQEELRIVLVGKTGAGKSATGNTILRKEAFASRISPAAVTTTCEKKKTQFDGKTLVVVDTPGLFDPDETEEKLAKNMATCVSLAAPGPHVFVVVLMPARFTKEEQETVKNIQKTFGEAASRYTMALFTCGDNLMQHGTSIEDFIAEKEDLRAFIRQCGGGYHVFNNRDKDPSQVRELLEKINTMVQINGGSYYTTEMFKEAEKAIEKEKEKLLRENPNMTSKEARRRAEEQYAITAAAAVVGAAAGVGIGGAVAVKIQVAATAGSLVGGPVGAAIGVALAAAIVTIKRKSEKQKTQ